MIDIEQALVELEEKSWQWRSHPEDEDSVDLANDLVSAIDNLAALRAKEARENALYAPQWRDAEYGVAVPAHAQTLASITAEVNVSRGDLVALHPFDKAEGKYTGEVITGEELAELLEVKQ